MPRGRQGWQEGMTVVEQEKLYCTVHEKGVRNTALMLVKKEEVKNRTQRCKEGYHRNKTAELNTSPEYLPSLAGTSCL